MVYIEHPYHRLPESTPRIQLSLPIYLVGRQGFTPRSSGLSFVAQNLTRCGECCVPEFPDRVPIRQPVEFTKI